MPAGSDAALPGERRRARAGTPRAERRRATAPPMVPVAPITRMDIAASDGWVAPEVTGGAGGGKGGPERDTGPEAEAPGPVRVLPVEQTYCIRLSSTRRFCWRPATVLFEAIGWSSPYPLAVTWFALTPLAMRNAITDSARAWERRWLLAFEPTASVWPPTSTL